MPENDEKKKNKKQKEPNGNQNQRKQLTKGQLQAAAQSWKQQFPELNPENILKSAADKDGIYDQFSNENSKIRYRQRDMQSLIGRKVVSEISKKFREATGSELAGQQLRIVEDMILADDLFDSIRKHGSSLFNTIKPIARTAIKQFYPEMVGVFDSVVGAQEQNQEFRVKRRYMLAPALINTANHVYQIHCNPGVASFGQWVSGIAPAFQYYRMHGMTIEYVPSTSVTTTGSLQWYLELDVESPVPSSVSIPQLNKAQVHALYQKSTTDYTESELNQTVRRLRVRTRDDQGAPSFSEFDFANFYYSSSTVSNSAFGNFFVEIDVTFYVPTLASQLLTTSTISQAVLSYPAIQLTANPMLQLDETAERLINGQLVRGYRVLTSGILRILTYVQGTNSVAVSRPVFVTSSTPTAGFSTMQTEFQSISLTSGSQNNFTVATLQVQQAYYVYITPSSSSEISNGRFYAAYSLDPYFMRLGFMSQQDMMKEMFKDYQAQNQNRRENSVHTLPIEDSTPQ